MILYDREFSDLTVGEVIPLDKVKQLFTIPDSRFFFKRTETKSDSLGLPRLQMCHDEYSEMRYLFYVTNQYVKLLHVEPEGDGSNSGYTNKVVIEFLRLLAGSF